MPAGHTRDASCETGGTRTHSHRRHNPSALPIELPSPQPQQGQVHWTTTSLLRLFEAVQSLRIRGSIRSLPSAHPKRLAYTLPSFLRLDSNQQPPGYEPGALPLSYQGLTKLPRLGAVAISIQSPKVAQLPGTAPGYRDDVVYLQLGSRSADLAGKPIPCEHLSPDRGPVARTALVPSRDVLPGFPGLVLLAPTIPEGLDEATLGQADRVCSWHAWSPRQSRAGCCRGWFLLATTGKSWPWLDTCLTARALRLLGSRIKFTWKQ